VDEPGFLSCVAFSPDGQRLAVGGKSGVVILFHLSEPRAPLRLERHTTRVSKLAFSPDGELLASGGGEQIHLWHPTTGAHVGTLEGHAGGITALSFSSAGDLLASASVDGTVRLWSTVRSECVGQIRVGPARVWVAQCSPADRTVATASEDGAVRVWSLDSSECLMVVRGYSNKTWSLAFSPHRSLLFAGYDDAVVRGWDLREARVEAELAGHVSRVWTVACSPDGWWVASGSDDLSVRLWDLRSGACRHVLAGHTDWVRALAFDPESRLLASAAEDGCVILWDVESGALVRRIEGGIPRILVAVEFCDGGRYLAVGGADPTVFLFSSADGSPQGELTGHEGWVRSLTPLGDEAAVLASCGEDGMVMVWDVQRRACTTTLEVGSKLWCGAFCDGGEGFITGSEDGVLRRWSLRSGRCETQARAPEGTVWTLAVSPAEDCVATAGNDGSIRLWHLPELVPYAAGGALRPPRPYEAMNISGATGLSAPQREALLALGALSF
jgi:WD40 repeat protein